MRRGAPRVGGCHAFIEYLHAIILFALRHRFVADYARYFITPPLDDFRFAADTPSR